MTILRRQFLRLTASAVALAAMQRMAMAQGYPARPVRLIVGQSAGGAQDIAARLMAQALSERFGRPFVVENKPGAGTNIAVEAVINSKADGYTLLLVGAPNAINATLYKNLNFNFIHDVAPVASFMRTPEVLVVHPSMPATTILEFVAYAKRKSEAISMASPGIGSGPHMSAELLKLMTGIQFTHVPYRGGGQAISDLVGGQVQAMFIAPVVAMQHIRSGKLRALAVTSSSRSRILPDVPTMAEFLPGYESGGFFGLGAPANTSSEIIAVLNRAINASLETASMQARIADMGASNLAGSPAAFGQLIAEQTEKWRKVIKSAGIRMS